MSLVSASQVSLAYGPKVLLDRAGLSIGPHDRIGLVGFDARSVVELAPDTG